MATFLERVAHSVLFVMSICRFLFVSHLGFEGYPSAGSDCTCDCFPFIVCLGCRFTPRSSIFQSCRVVFLGLTSKKQ